MLGIRIFKFPKPNWEFVELNTVKNMENKVGNRK